MIVDLFAGAGGWEVGARTLGLEPVGFEHDRAACATRAAAGMATVRADVAAWPLGPLAGKVEGLIASPPCQAFSRAGKRRGLADDRGRLVWEPLRWAEALRPRWVACEQVPDVLPIWRATARRLNGLGYSTWCGTLDAADCGVPQNRVRAILIARLDGPAVPPAPSHSQDGSEPGMFGGGTLPWVAMADALGWPSHLVLHTNRYQRPDGTRQTMPVDRPAPEVTTPDGMWKLQPGSWADGRGGNRRLYDRTEPAHTVALGHDTAGWCWTRPATTVQGDPRIAQPGHHDRQMNDAVRVELHELAALQGFPPDHPWKGTRSQIALQIGNAICPPLAAAVLGAATGAHQGQVAA